MCKQTKAANRSCVAQTGNPYLRFTIYDLRLSVLLTIHEVAIYDLVGRRDFRDGRSGAVIEPACTGG